MRSEQVDHPALPVPLTIRKSPRARLLRMRFDEAANALLLTCPAGVSRRDALLWAGRQVDWARRQVAARPPARPFVPGGTIPFDGGELLLVHDPAVPRRVVLDGARLLCGGPAESFARRIETWLRERALETLSRETAEFAARAGVSVRSVAVGDASSRWGSCTADGAIRYSWRLILAPPAARRFVVAHEVAHRLHMDHGRAFKALERRLLGGSADSARRLLRELGPALRLVGRW